MIPTFNANKKFDRWLWAYRDVKVLWDAPGPK